MLIKANEARRKENAPGTIVWEYDFPNKNLGFAIAHMNGRYPESGKVVNHKCDEMYFILSGKGTIHTEAGTYEINEGDCFLFEKGNRYWVEGDNLRIALPTAPARSLDQYEELHD